MTTSSSSQTLLEGSFYTGTDLGLKHDYSAVALVKKVGQEVYLMHLRRFKLGTEFASVLGWIRILNDRCQSVHRNLIDQTGMGEFFVQEAVKSGLKNTQGIMLSLPSKQEVLGYLKQLMEARRLQIFYDVDLINEVHLERYELSKVGQIMFSHPQGTHDDRFWSLALAVYASRPEIPKFTPFAAVGPSPSGFRRYAPNIPRGILRPG